MADEDLITYVDLGDRTLEIDNRGPVQRRTILPKSARDIGVATAMRQELEDRIEAEHVAPAKMAEEAASDPNANLPPAESDEDRAKREKAAEEAIAKADEQAAGETEEAQERVRQAAPAQTSGSKKS